MREYIMVYVLLPESFQVLSFLVRSASVYGGLAQLARALAWHARGQRFESVILHHPAHSALLRYVSGPFFDILTHKTCK